MNLELKRKLKLESYDVIMDIGRNTKRPDLIAVLKLADEMGYVTSNEIITRLLGDNYPKSVGERIITRCKELGLLDPENNLTETAREAIEGDVIFLPERGTYRIWFTRDPLFPQGCVSIRTGKNNTLYNEVKEQWEISRNKKKKEKSGV